MAQRHPAPLPGSVALGQAGWVEQHQSLHGPFFALLCWVFAEMCPTEVLRGTVIHWVVPVSRYTVRSCLKVRLMSVNLE